MSGNMRFEAIDASVTDPARNSTVVNAATRDRLAAGVDVHVVPAVRTEQEAATIAAVVQKPVVSAGLPHANAP
jgi:hypothetical protein